MNLLMALLHNQLPEILNHIQSEIFVDFENMVKKLWQLYL